MEKNIKEAISIIEDVRKSMPECANKAFLKGAINELNEALKEFTPFSLPHFNQNDYVVLNPIGELSHIGKDEIAVGIKNFKLLGASCLMDYNYEGKVYKRIYSDAIPRNLIGQICSVQVYKLVKK